jgi:acyl-CoA thioester hydrolase
MVYEHKVQYYETDKMQIVHHSNYVRWMEEARVEFLERIGASFVRLEEQGIVSPVTEVNCRYVNMMRFGDTAKITACLEDFGGVKMTVRYLIQNAANGEVCCIAESRHCFMYGGKIVNMKRKFPQIYERFVPHIGEDGDVIASCK